MNFETSCVTMERGGLDPKSLWRQGAFFQAHEHVQINAGRQQQAGKKDYRDFFVAFIQRHAPFELKPGRYVQDASFRIARHFLSGSYVTFARVVSLEYGSSDWVMVEHAERERPRLFANVLLQPVKELEKRGHIDAALDVLYSRIDRLFRAKEFASVDNLLQQVVVDSLTVDVLLGLLTSTLPAKSKLPARSKFYIEVEASIKKRNEWEDGLLTGLES